MALLRWRANAGELPSDRRFDIGGTGLGAEALASTGVEIAVAGVGVATGDKLDHATVCDAGSAGVCSTTGVDSGWRVVLSSRLD